MTRKAVSLYMAATSATAILAPGRFACGIVLSLEICFLMAFGTLFRRLLEILRLEQLKTCAMCVFLVSCAMAFREILTLFMPEMALQLSFVIFIPSFSVFTSLFSFGNDEGLLKEDLSRNMKGALLFSSYVLPVSFLRDILGFGTLTFPAFGKMAEKVVFDSGKISLFSFLATFPGALVFSALVMIFYLAFEKRMNLVEKEGIEND